MDFKGGGILVSPGWCRVLSGLELTGEVTRFGLISAGLSLGEPRGLWRWVSIDSTVDFAIPVVSKSAAESLLPHPGTDQLSPFGRREDASSVAKFCPPGLINHDHIQDQYR